MTRFSRIDQLSGHDQPAPQPPGNCPCCDDRLIEETAQLRADHEAWRLVCPACGYPDTAAAFIDYDGCC
ncbi:hypothetical protein [Croceicoccus mobilis]|uniref:hypothetical protein n=1 Tax=Croceicoccus mobilis TaxID=1703339 RepID=UPI00083648EA|nr:hypothetical protein [Croceicoccus mobilis]